MAELWGVLVGEGGAEPRTRWKIPENEAVVPDVEPAGNRRIAEKPKTGPEAHPGNYHPTPGMSGPLRPTLPAFGRYKRRYCLPNLPKVPRRYVVRACSKTRQTCRSSTQLVTCCILIRKSSRARCINPRGHWRGGREDTAQ